MPALLAGPQRTMGALVRTVEVGWSSDRIPSDVTWVHDWRDGKNVVLSLGKASRDYWLRVPGIADVLLQLVPARRALISTYSTSTDAATLEHILVDQILPRLLAQSGESMLHASALSIDGKHALFLGPSGCGKSTLAGLLQHCGHAVLSDDCVQLELVSGRLCAIPTYPSLRLNPDSMDALFPGVTDTAAVADYSAKRRVAVGSTSAQTASDTVRP